MTQAFALFPTEIGLCGVIWDEVGLTGVLLPEISEAASRARIAKRHPVAVETVPTGMAAVAVERIRTLMVEGNTTLIDLTLNMQGLSPLLKRIYAVTRAIKPGATRTYGQIAKEVGADPRSVGQAMGRNPWPIVVPCHRVMGSDGKLVGFSAHGGLATKLKLLAIEKALISEAPGLFDEIGGLPIGIRD